MRKFWILFLVAGLAGGGLGLVATSVLLEPPSLPLYEAKIESVALSEEEASVVGSAFLRATSVSTEMRWLLPVGETSGSRAAAVGALLLLDSTIEQLGDTVGLSPVELRVRMALEPSGAPEVLFVKIWGTSEEQSQQLVAAVSDIVQNLDREFFPGQAPPILLDVSSAAPPLLDQTLRGEVLAWRNHNLPQTDVPQPRTLPGLDSLRVAAEEAYFSLTAPNRVDASDATGAPVLVTFSTQNPNRLVAVVQHPSSEVVSAELEAVADALELAGQRDELHDDSSAVVVLDVRAPVRALSAPSVDRAPVVVTAGVLLGVSLAGLFALLSLSQRRLLWSPSQMFAVTDSPPLAVVPVSRGDQVETGFAAENSGIVSLRTNLFFADNVPRSVVLTSPASIVDQGQVGMALAESLAQLGGRVAVLDAGAGESLLGFTGVGGAETKSVGGSPPRRPAALALDGSSSGAFDVLTLDRKVSGSSNFYLSPDWPAALSWLDQHYDYCLIVLSPVVAGLGATEAAIGAARVALVIAPGETKPHDLAAAVAQLTQSGSPAPEIVVVGIPAQEVSDWYMAVSPTGLPPISLR